MRMVVMCESVIASLQVKVLMQGVLTCLMN